MDAQLIRKFLDKKNIFAVVGASRNPSKYGHQVYRDLKEAGYEVYPVNPNAEEILGNKCYPSLEYLPVNVDVVDIVVPPKMQKKREEFYEPKMLIQNVKTRVRELKEKREPVDYLTFVPDGETTLDVNLGKEIKLLKPVDVKTAVITNASLIWDADVKKSLLEADWVSLKVDAVSKEVWKKINRPHGALSLESILNGMIEFSADFNGILATETMLVNGVNDKKDEIEKIAEHLSFVSPDISYISIPTRPTAEKWAEPAEESKVGLAYQLFSKRELKAEYLIGYEGNAFASTGDFENDMLSITSVHPMREEAVNELLQKNNASWDVVKELINEDKLVELEFDRKNFYVRKFPDVKRR